MIMRDEYVPVIGIERRDAGNRMYMSAKQGGVLGGPSMEAGNGGLLYGLDFQLDSGHALGDGGEEDTGGVRVYEMHYVPPGLEAIGLARIFVAGDVACDLLDSSRGVWIRFEAKTERWYLNGETLATLAATEQGGKIIVRIAHASCPGGTSLDAVGWGDTATTVEQVAARDVLWQESDEPSTWDAGACSFSLSSDTPASLRDQPGCLLALCLTVTTETGADGQPIYSLSTTEWHQGEGQSLLFADWSEEQSLVLERSSKKPADSVHVAHSTLDLRSSS